MLNRIYWPRIRSVKCCFNSVGHCSIKHIYVCINILTAMDISMHGLLRNFLRIYQLCIYILKIIWYFRTNDISVSGDSISCNTNNWQPVIIRALDVQMPNIGSANNRRLFNEPFKVQLQTLRYVIWAVCEGNEVVTIEHIRLYFWVLSLIFIIVFFVFTLYALSFEVGPCLWIIFV